MKKYYIASGTAFVLFLVLILLVRTVDVADIGPAGTSIGLSHLNQAFHTLTGVHMIWYKITEILGVLAIGVAAMFALMGFLQLIRRRSLLKVDSEIMLLAGLYIITMGLYFFFEGIIVNYRPVIMPDNTVPEASFPSSHTMLICVIMGSTVIMLRKYVRDVRTYSLLRILCYAVMAVTVFGRLVCGVHWLTDIIGGVLISAAMLSMFSGLTQ